MRVFADLLSVIARECGRPNLFSFCRETGRPDPSLRCGPGDDEKNCRRESGSVLIEAMVGAAIISMTLLAMYESIVTATAHNRMAENRRTAMMIAQSEMAAVGTIIPSSPGTTEGTEGDFYWRVDIAPFGQSAQPQLGQVPSQVGALCSVTVTVTDRRRAPLASLTSLTLSRSI